ncbi:hypothetical protein GCM10017714_07160 [Curtobacterium pusillum]|uniref:Uncharacterized protein n=1 Tax=Curtobacterium pusillum TaxID=69373 RepID=A0ABX2M5Z9_9MICO|nr:hypothetical protein [Curtobacterium pusillum]NUU13512.1 hypothetical protein [Curtobacterium pusillum]GLK29979.1 hypothetical protein GCM10017610_02640 [Curtobacterium pusillum]
MPHRTTTVAALAVAAVVTTTVLTLPTAAVAAPATTAPATTAKAPAGSGGTLTNLDHLDFLLDDVPLLSGVPGHTTYDQASDPTARAPWVYADRDADGTYRRVGGGTLDPATGHWGQGAFDADDISRAAVVYVRDWEQDRTPSSLDIARELLRSLTYLQTSTGPDAGNVVLWQQPDGTLDTTPTPPDSPNPSDSADSFWTARTIWALGEAYPAFRHTDPGFARFLQDRLHLAIGALERGSLAQYGRYDTVNGSRVPAWLIADSTSATAEAVLGLSAYSAAVPSDHGVRTVLQHETEGIAGMQRGGPGTWPYGAVLPSATSQSTWNAWGGMAPAALARAGAVLHRSAWEQDAERATAQFGTQLLTSGGPDNGWTPTPFDRTQIAYGADSLVESFTATADATGNDGQAALAGIAASWFFGANPAGVPVYDRATGACVDGIAADGTVNRGCGAESAIHTALTMLALDAHPAIRAAATAIDGRSAVQGITTVEAESGVLGGGATVVQNATAWTGSANWSGSASVQAPAGGTVTIALPAGHGPVVLAPVVSQQAGAAGTTTWTTSAPGRPTRLGTTQNGGAGEQGSAPTSTFLHPLRLATVVPAGVTSITARVTSGALDLDAVLVQPVVAHLGLTGAKPVDLVVDSTGSARSGTIVGGRGRTASVFDADGRLVRSVHLRADSVPLAPGGFTVVG